MNSSSFEQVFSEIQLELKRVLVGQDELARLLMIAVLAKGHVLIEGAPGLGKTLLVRALAHVTGATFKRIQFTPDLMPSDVTGDNVYDASVGKFTFIPGPVFTQLLLADEINRAPAKTQSALLEAMQESSVTKDGKTRILERPFCVVATQNPIESQGTYPLPEAQLDRFQMKLEAFHPSVDDETQILRNYLDGFDPSDLGRVGLRRVLPVATLIEMQDHLNSIRVEPELLRYITEIVARTRSHPHVYLGASPRASVSLLMSARAQAASEGRDYVIPDDVKALARPVLRHRLLLHPDAELENVTADDCVESILREARVPKTAA